MSRIAIPTRHSAPEATKPTLEVIHEQLGFVPNLFRLIANSPAALTATRASMPPWPRRSMRRPASASRPRLPNGCDYCLSAHTYLRLNLAKFSPEEVVVNRRGTSGDATAAATVSFAAKVARERGYRGEADCAAIRSAGYSDAQIVEIVALVAENTFTNYLNEVAGTDIDFPAVHAGEAA